MKFVRQVRLFFREGTSDKVYEIDLCESSSGEYLVNFRYGRRGNSLKEGTKTIFPVPLAEAEKIFRSLEQEKLRKGYSENEPGQLPEISGKPISGEDDHERIAASILVRLQEAVAGKKQTDWKLSRIIWRAGEFRLHEAESAILRLADLKDSFNIYSTVWALSRCGGTASVSFIRELILNKELPEYIRQLAQFSLLVLLDGDERKTYRSEILAKLSEPFRLLVDAGKLDELEKQLRELLDLRTTDNSFLIPLYQLSLDDAELKKMLLRIFADINFRTGIFRRLRAIFKASEMLDDFAMYALLARRFEKTPANYKSKRDGVFVDGNYVRINEEKKRPESRLVFSSATKDYLVQRILRRLKDSGETKRKEYAMLAASLLLQYDDTRDNPKSRKETQYKYHYDQTTRNYTSETIHTHFDIYSDAHLLNTILYSRSPRYMRKYRNKEWICQPSYEPGQAAPVVREEAFPEIWDLNADLIFQLLGESRCLRVHEFAVKVFRANSSFPEKVSEEYLSGFLVSGFAITENLAIEIVREKFLNNSPGKMLLIALLGCSNSEGRQLAQQWVMKQRIVLLSDALFVSQLIGVRNEETRAWLSGLISMDAMPGDIASKVVDLVIEQMVKLAGRENEEKETESLGAFLLQHFEAVLSEFSFEKIRLLLDSGYGALHVFAGRILLRHKKSNTALPEELLLMLLQSPEAAARSAGIGLLGRQSNDQLMNRRQMLVSFCLSPLPDVRAAVRPLIEKLSLAFPDFAREMAMLFLPALQMKESYEGVHADLLSILRRSLATQLGDIDKERILKLIQSKFSAAQELGFFLLQQNLKPKDLSVAELVKLGSHALRDLREWIWSVFDKEVIYIKTDKEFAIRLADSVWDDTRAFAFRFFREQFEISDWTPQLFVMLCDSVQEDVQAYGREMITRCFKDSSGREFLTKLSQHPDSRMQLFASSFLEKYAGGNSDLINLLEPYFLTLLSQVNKGRAAKERAFAFLENESLQREETALLTARLLSRISATIAIHDKAKCIVLLSKLQKKYPSIQSPLVIKEIREFQNASL